MAKKEKTPKNVLERTYNIPLRKEWLKVSRYKRAKKAAKAVREFLMKHMKSENVKIGKNLNLKLWERGIRNPPHHVKVNAVKYEDGLVKAELFGFKIEEEPKKEIKKEAKKTEEEVKKELGGEEKKEVIEEKKEKKEETEKKEEKPAEEKKTEEPGKEEVKEAPKEEKKPEKLKKLGKRALKKELEKQEGANP